MPTNTSPAFLVANAGSVLALVLMMLGVGLAVGPNITALPRALDRKTAVLQVLANVVCIPVTMAALLLLLTPVSGVTAALLLLACFPAGPISLMFVNQDSDALTRSTAIVLLLQFASVLISPIVLIGIGGFVTGKPLVADSQVAAVNMASQMVLLEIAPILLGALWSRRLIENRDLVRRRLRKGAMLCLGVAGVAFSTLYLGTFGSSWGQALVYSLVLLSVSWGLSILLRGSATRHDSAQIGGLRNISLSLVVAGTTAGLEGAVVFVLLSAGVVTGGAPLLRVLRARRLAASASEGA